MATTFALATSGILIVYAAWSAYVVASNAHDDLEAYLDHESNEFLSVVSKADGSSSGLQDAFDHFTLAELESHTGFRIRDAGGRTLMEAGERAILDTPDSRSSDDDGWWDLVFQGRVVTTTVDIATNGLHLDLIVDTKEYRNRVFSYLISSGLAFLLALGLAAGAGWYAAHRGLLGLRQVIAQASGIDPPSRVTRIHLDDAPTEIREVANALNDMIDRIDSSMERLKTFTAGLAHELRSPLQNLIGETEVTLLSDRSVTEYQKSLRSNLVDLHELSDSIDNLVAMCRSAADASSMSRRERFDLATEADLRLQRERRSAERDGVRLEIQASGDTTLFADREACLRVARNLVGNAVHWSPAGGTVRVGIHGADRSVILSVEDEGPGVPEELGDRIFEAFTSGSRSSPGRAGYGLGLAICRAVVNEHRGTLTFENRASSGACFRAEFPRDSSTEHDAPMMKS